MKIFSTGNLGMDAFSGSFVFSPVDRVGPRDITITATASNGQTFTLTRGVRSGVVNGVHTHTHTHAHTHRASD